jgi:hypothetical protein
MANGIGTPQGRGPGGRSWAFFNPDLLRGLRRDLLLAWLAPARGHLEQRGWVWPRGDEALPMRIDYDGLADILLEPRADTPGYLADSLFLISGMANPAGMDVILARAARAGLNLGETATLAPADTAVSTWLKDPGLLEDLHNCRELTRPRAFLYFSTHVRPLPEFPGPQPGQLERLEQRLNSFFVAWKRGKGARVFAYRREHEWWFLVRHGATCGREPALEDGEPTAVFFRPQRHDVLRLDPGRGEIGIHCCAERERRVLLRLFGACLFGRPDFFPGRAKYTLAPLVRRGRACLDCTDTPGVHQVRLTDVEFRFRREPWHRILQSANDLFALIEQDGWQWPEQLEDITRATFAVTLRDARRSRTLTLQPCNKALYSHEGDSALLENWMTRRGFILPPAAVGPCD